MLYQLILVSLAGLGAAGPTSIPPIDFNLILTAAGPSLSGPPVTAASQTGVYNTAAAVSSATVTSAASAAAQSSVTGTAAMKRRDLDKRGFCFLWWCVGTTSSTTSSAKVASSTICTTSTTKGAPVVSTTSTPAVTSKATAVATSAPAITSAPSVPSTCTPVSWSNTNAFTTASACPEPFEVGTYCGFINPEDPCAIQPDGYGAQVQPDTVDAFEAYQPFRQLAQNAKTPSGYASTFKDLNAAVSANSYMGLYTLKSYNVSECAARCDNTPLCTGINIYIERDPSINPSGCTCTNPQSITNYKCTLWGSGVESAAATNSGQTRDGFQVVITGSNGYEKTNNTIPATPSGWTNPQGCRGQVHNHPSTCLGQKFFPGPFDINVCAAYAASQNAVNAKSLGLASWLSWLGYSPMKCNFFNAFMIKQNGVAKGTYCSLFTQQYKPSAAQYQPGNSNGNDWSVESSWSFCSS